MGGEDTAAQRQALADGKLVANMAHRKGPFCRLKRQHPGGVITGAVIDDDHLDLPVTQMLFNLVEQGWNIVSFVFARNDNGNHGCGHHGCA